MYERGSLPSYRVELFGSVRVLRDSTEVVLSAYESALVGVVYAQEEKKIPRRDAALLIWGSHDSRARHRLSQLIYSLRRKTGIRLVVGLGEELFPLRDRVTCDVWDLVRLCDGQEVSEAKKLLGCGLLSSGSLPTSKNLEEWIDETEARLRRVVLRTAQEVWRSAERTSDWVKGVEAASAGYALEPWNEEWLRRMMTAYTIAGDPESAAEAYRSHVRWLSDNMPGTSPSEESQQLFVRIERAAKSEASEARKSPVEKPGLCGRRNELARLRGLLLRPANDRIQFVLIRGDAGVGKTRLIEECLKEVRLRGTLLLRSRAAELERWIPLNLLSEALSSSAVVARLDSVSQPWRDVLAELLPELRLSGGRGTTSGVEPVALQRRLFEAIRQLFQALTKGERAILVLDDFHCADVTSVAALEYMRRRWQGGDLMVVAACRTDSETPDSDVARFINRLEREAESVVLDLPELSEDDSETLIRQIAKGKLQASEISQILALAGGVPFFLIELTLERLLARSGERPATGKIPIPISIRQLLEERVARVSRNARRVLDALAVWGRRVSLRQVCAVARLPKTSVIDCLDELEGARLVRWKRGRVWIAHELMREARYRLMGEAERALLHRRAAKYMIKLCSTATGEIAIHCERGGDRKNAFRFAEEAALRAEQKGAFAEAIAFWEIARRTVPEEDRLTPVLGRLAELHYLRMNLAAADALLGAVARRYRAAGEGGKALEAEARGAEVLSERVDVPLTEILERLEGIRREARQAGRWDVVAQMLSFEWRLRDDAGQGDRIAGLIAECKECIAHGNGRARCIALRTLAICELYYGNPDVSLDHARKGVSVAADAGLEHELLRCLNAEIATLASFGLLHTPEGKGVMERADALAARSADVAMRYSVRLNVGVWLLDIGELAAAERCFGEARGAIDASEAERLRTLLDMNLGELYYEAGEVERAREAFSAALERCSSGRLWPWALAAAHAGLGMCALYAGNLGEVRLREDLLSRVTAGRSLELTDRSMIVRFQAHVAQRRGDLRAAAEILENVARHVRSRHVPFWIRLKLDKARFLSRAGRSEAVSVAREAYEVASALGLERRCQQLEAFL